MPEHKIERFDRPTAKKMREAINTELASLEEYFGVTVNLGNIRYSDDSLSVKLELRVGGDPEEHARKDWEKNCAFYGFKAEDFGREFTYALDTYKVVGINPRSRKFPLVAERVKNGKQYKMPVSVVPF